MTRDEWLAGLRTFDRVWLPGKYGEEGGAITIVRWPDGSITDSQHGRGRDLRQDPIEPYGAAR